MSSCLYGAGSVLGGWRGLPDVDGVGTAVYDGSEAIGNVGRVGCAGGGSVADVPDGVVVVDFGRGGEDVGGEVGDEGENVGEECHLE